MITAREFFRKAWTVLVDHAGASRFPDEEDRFVFLQSNEHVAEYRFGGKLGFGGKFWRNAGRFYVSAYTEDVKAHPSMQEVVDDVNDRLQRLTREHPEAMEWT
jgi:hypothetical protein